MTGTCPTCGQAVRVVGGEEGTMHYEPAAQVVKGGPSGAAYDVAEAAVTWTWQWAEDNGRPFSVAGASRRALDRSHDPPLGLDRSVRLGDVVAWLSLRSACHSVGVPGGEAAQNALAQAAVHLRREFGATTHAE